ncbi:mitochondrial cardiolipin hydrolase [Octopus sinensis]|uniref:Mitochondrial cardiolipin hydrolase n=1 Tax=Octopus sinensis TaxID=2607531 RepID=A0A6P7U681_9MOLL|nr:mitochondrial cardiolipin hydrolase [Octopus sinensis]
MLPSKIIPSLVSFMVGLISSGLVIGTVYKLYGYGVKKLRKGRRGDEGSEDEDEIFTEVLMFPDKHIACKNNFLLESGCVRSDCSLSHYKTSLSEIYRRLCAAKKYICVCVFHITYKDLVDILIAMNKKGVCIQVITDDEKTDSESQVDRLRAHNIPVRTDHSSSFMHHKFTVIDRKIVIHGSFNWTFSAINGNLENVLITNDSDIAQNFQREFDLLWTKFDMTANNQKHTNGCIKHIKL